MRTMALLIGLSLSLAAQAGTAFFQYEQITGLTKQCVYDYLGNRYTITISAVSLCPLTIQV